MTWAFPAFGFICSRARAEVLGQFGLAAIGESPLDLSALTQK